MKHFLALSLLMSTSAFAVSGTSVFEDVRGTSRATITVQGNTAEMMFDALSNSRIVMTTDASESPDGRRHVWKEGVNYTCDMAMGAPGQKNKYSCAIPFTSKSRGEVGIAGVAYPASNSGVTNTPGTSSAEVRSFQNRRRQVVSLSIYGGAAERAYNLLDVRVLNYGRGVDAKEEGQNINCSKRAESNKPVKFRCDLLIESKAAGRITHPGVG